MSVTRRLWDGLKHRSPRLAKLVETSGITCVGGEARARAIGRHILSAERRILSVRNRARRRVGQAVSRLRGLGPMTLAQSHVTFEVAMRTRRGGARTRLKPEPFAAGSAEDGDRLGVGQRWRDVLAMEYLDRRYRRVYRGLLRWRCEGEAIPDSLSGRTIMFVSGSLGPGGSERQTVATLRGLAARGYSSLALLCVHLADEVNNFYRHLLEGCPMTISELRRDQGWPHGDGASGETPTGAHVVGLPGRLPPELEEIRLYAREILARKPAVVHTWLDEVNIKAGLAAMIVGVPRIVLSTRSVAPDNFAIFRSYMREGYRALLRHPRVVLLNNSQAGARDYEQWLALPRDTVKVIRNGFDFAPLEHTECRRRGGQLRNRFGIPADATVVGSALRFSEEKQPLLWIDVAQRVLERRGDVLFLIVGDGPLRGEARRYAEAKGIARRIVMPGYERDAAAAIAAMDVFLLTSRAEGLPNVLIEAQGFGVPVVTTNAGGAAETLDEGRTGFAVPHCAERLAQAVLRILGDAAWRQAVRTAAPRFVREQFSTVRMVDRTLDAYLGRGMFAPMPGERDGKRRQTARRP